ncbi:MAG: 4-hydroxy-tetrahydrodipicolinate reductase [Ruminococcaceae bacterium]|nr:4-hydroxy-tetrahydrodipicolinate reductase [Oscillospiraceae bacterium]
MTKILLSGCHGRMGRAVLAATQNTDLTVISGTDINAGTSNFPVYTNIADAAEIPDVIIDFSHHTALPAIMDYAVKNNVPCVICTTGHTEEEYNVMYEAAKSIPVFFSRNMSLGVNLLIALCKKASAALGMDYDVEIIEKHHHNKLDAPSGTALMIADAISETRTESEYVYDRSTVRKKREQKEIGISAIRGGSIIGEHEVLFAGKDEVLTISHSASSRELFATGALRAAEFIIGKSAGMYNMDNMFEGLI